MKTKSVTGHKVISVIALAGLFACGFALGYALRGNMFGSDSVHVDTNTNSLENRNEMLTGAFNKRLFPVDDPNPIAHIYNAILYESAPDSYDENIKKSESERFIASMLKPGVDFSRFSDIDMQVRDYIKNSDYDMQEFKNRFKIQK